ncbi:MAG: hypothetical protein IJK02_10820 [Clostridia bacterium]|nr:hypothetical protein [Clostridia bacterium]
MKKLVGLLLSFCLLVCMIPVCTGTAAASEAVRQPYPLVIIRGMDFMRGLKYNAGTPEEADAHFAFSLKDFLSFTGKAAKGMAENGKAGFTDALFDYAYSLFAVYACDGNGDSLDPSVSAVTYDRAVSEYDSFWDYRTNREEGLLQSAMNRYGAENVYFFKYDWRLDAAYNAERLHTVIENACADHGTDKVDLVCCSMGGLVSLAYLGIYGSGRIDSLVADSSAMYGSDVATELLTGQISFAPDAVYRYLASHAGAAAPLVWVLYKLGVIKGICNFLNTFKANYEKEIYDRVLTPVFGTMPAIWELVDPDVYADAKAYIFGDGTDAYAGLLEKTDRIQQDVISQREFILDGAMANGMKFAAIAGYDTPNAPAYPGGSLQGDGILETRCMSFGATVSEVGGKLTDEQLTGDARYISADHCINANTALYKEYTWFVKDSEHVGCMYNSEYTMLIFAILEAEIQPTVDTWEKYPQFLQADKNENLSPVTDAPGKWDRK